MSIPNLISRAKANYENLLNFLEDEEKGEILFLNLNNILDDIKKYNSKHEFTLFLKILLNIYDNHNRNPNFSRKIELILTFFKKEIQRFYSNSDLFNFFKSNKKILLFLIKENMLIIDNCIIKEFLSSQKYYDTNYPQFFLKECEPFFNDDSLFESEEGFLPEYWIEEDELELPENFEMNREIGENENYICKLIRNDSIEEFVAYMTKTNYSLNSEITSSIYETNSFLVKKQSSENKPKLIEYAAFYGSIQIFQYLMLNGVKLEPTLWLYSIHSNNPDLIHILERNEIQFDPKLLFKESVKCHHNEIANYIKENYLCNFSDDIEYALKYCNFAFIDQDSNMKDYLYSLCIYDYSIFVDLLMKEKDLDINKKIILGSIILTKF